MKKLVTLKDYEDYAIENGWALEYKLVQPPHALGETDYTRYIFLTPCGNSVVIDVFEGRVINWESEEDYHKES